jgi:MFS family permease
MRNIYLLAIISLLTDVHSEIIMSILPVFMVEELKIGRLGVGIIEGLSDTLTSFLKLWSGWVSDRFGRKKPFVLAGYTISTISKSFMTFVRGAFDVLLIRIIDRIGKGIRTSPRDALISESVSSGIRGRAFGIHRAADTMGAIIGSLSAMVGMSLFGLNPRKLFIYAIFPGVLASLLTLFIKEGTKEKKEPGVQTPSYKPGKTATFFFITHTIFTMGSLSYAFYLLKLREAGFSPSLVPAGYLLFNLVYASMAYPLGILSDRLGGFRVLLIGYLVHTLINFLAIFTYSLPLGILLMFGYGVGMGITEAVGRRTVADLSKVGERGRAYGIFHFLLGIVILPANAFAGYLWDKLGSKSTFIFGTSMCFISFVMMLCFLKIQKQ